jgi:serine/threonine protein kinase
MRVCTHCRLSLKQGEESCPRDSAPGHDVAFDVIPPILAGKLQQIEAFARGDTGSLYLARTGRAVAPRVVKLLRAEVVEQVSERSRLKRELRKQTTLTNNSLVRIHDGGEEGAVLWLSRDYIEGESLAVKLKRERVIEPTEAYAIVAQVASALDELHRSGLLHRDVKPGHILLGASSDGAPVATLIDACVPARLDAGGVFPLLGTPGYMAPEQGAGKPVSFRSDLYALGCLFHEMLTGAPPFSGADAQAVLAQHMSAEPPAPGVELPPAVAQLLQNLLSKDPRRRPFSAQQVRRVLEPFLPASTPREASGGTTSAGRLSAPLGAAGPETVGFPRADSTEEIVLEEVAMRPPRPQPFPSERPAENLDADALQSLLVDDAPQPAASAGDDGDFVDFDAAAPAEPSAPAPALDAPAPPGAGSVPPPAKASVPPPAKASVPPPPPRASVPQPPPPRTSVPVVPRAQAQHDLDSQVTRVFRPDQLAPPPPGVARGGSSSKPPPPPGAASVPPMPPRAAAAVEPAVARSVIDSQPAPDPDGTVLLRRRPAPTANPMLWGAAGAVALVLLWLVFSGDDDEPTPAASDATQEAATAQPESEKTPEPSAGAAQPDKAGGAQAAQAEPTPAAAPNPSADKDAPAATDTDTGTGTGTAAGTGTGTGTAPATSAGAQAAAPGRAEQPSAGADRGDPGAASRRDSTAPPAGSRAERAAQAEKYKAEGRTHFQAGRFDDASRAYEKATRLSPADAGAFAGLGASRLQAKDQKGAIRAYERAVQLKPDVSGFHAALGKAYQEQGDKGRAIAAYRRALKLNPTNTPAKNALAALGAKP